MINKFISILLSILRIIIALLIIIFVVGFTSLVFELNQIGLYFNALISIIILPLITPFLSVSNGFIKFGLAIGCKNIICGYNASILLVILIYIIIFSIIYFIISGKKIFFFNKKRIVLIIAIVILLILGNFLIKSNLNDTEKLKDTYRSSAFRHCMDINLISDGPASRDMCFYNLAVKTNLPEICSQIREESDTQINCYTKIAKSKKDAKICGAYGIRHQSSICYAEVAHILQESTICEGKSGCYQFLAELEKDPKLCDKLSEPWYCYGKVTPEKLTIETCKALEPRAVFCYRELAIHKKEESLCSKQDDLCYKILAVLKRNEKICENISEESSKENCVWMANNTTKEDLNR